MPIFSKSWKWWLLPFTISRQYRYQNGGPPKRGRQNSKLFNHKRYRNEIFKTDKYKLKIKYNKIWGNQMRVFLSKGATKIQTF